MGNRPRPEAEIEMTDAKSKLLSKWHNLLCLLLLAGGQATQADVMYWPLASDLARQRAATVSCLNNLKDIQLAALSWANNNGGLYPPNIQSFSNYLSSPSV